MTAPARRRAVKYARARRRDCQGPWRTQTPPALSETQGPAMMDAEKVYSAANAAMSLANVALATLAVVYFAHRPEGRTLRRLAPPLAAHFGAGAVSHALLVSGCPKGVEVWWFVFRTCVTLALVPWLWYGLRSLSLLPTKEEWHRQIKEKTAALEAAERAWQEAERAKADLRKKYESDARRARKVADEYADLREWAKSQIWDKLSEQEVEQLRGKLHDLLNAAS